MTEAISHGEIEEFLQLDHPDFYVANSCYDTDTRTALEIRINGQMYKRGTNQQVGRYARTLSIGASARAARHDSFQVDEAFRRQQIASYHYRKCFSLYDHLRITKVEMYAVDFGAFVWPAFGFDFVEESEREQAVGVCRRMYKTETGEDIALEGYDRKALSIAFLEGTTGDELGFRALKTAARSLKNGGFQLVLDLEDADVREFLKIRNLLVDG